jgi:phosphatidylinositol-bisphosphatase
VERKSVSEGERYSHFEVITDNEIKGSQGRQRLDGSRDPHDLRKKRDKILLERLRRPSGSRPGVSKANMDQPELASKLTSSLKVTSSRWVSRYRPGVPVPMPNARESIVQAELRHRERDFCDRMKLRVFCGTWNVNGKLPTCSLDEWLLHHQGEGEGGSGIKPDIYAIGFQELDLSAQALMGVESGREEPWINAVEVSLKKAGPYHKLLHTRLVGIMLLVYITPQLLDAVSDQFVEYVTTGIGGVLGNKGGVGARFNLFHSSLCFVNCHFAASMEEVDKRNHDYHTIRNKMLFDKIQDYKYTIMDHDMVFWLGDMNYRIQTSEVMTVEVIKAHADTFQISSLLKQDQLVQEMTKGNIFTEFAEGAINFKPTYKYDVNSDNWDTRWAGL